MAFELVKRYAPDRVSNLMGVGGTRQVTFDVHSAERGRSVSKSPSTSLALSTILGSRSLFRPAADGRAQPELVIGHGGPRLGGAGDLRPYNRLIVMDLPRTPPLILALGLVDHRTNAPRLNARTGHLRGCGHTDLVEPDGHNLERAQRRAETVLTGLMRNGVDPGAA